MCKPLILMACSGTKLDHAAPAQDLYQGVMWQSLRANAPGGQLPHVVVLSALYGFVSGSQVIEPYDKLLTPVRSRELEFDLGQFVSSVAWPEDVTRILVAGGGLYRYLMRRMIGELIGAGKLSANLEISEVSGGIGMQRSQVGQFVRDPAFLRDRRLRDEPGESTQLRGQPPAGDVGVPSPRHGRRGVGTARQPHHFLVDGA